MRQADCRKLLISHLCAPLGEISPHSYVQGEFCVDKNEHTLPMVPAGARLHDMVLCPGQQGMTEEEMAQG